MTDPTTVRLVASGLYFLTALVWAIHAHLGWSSLLALGVPGRMVRVLPFVGTLASLHYLPLALAALVPEAPRAVGATLGTVSRIAMVGVAPVVRHQLRLMLRPESGPSRAWLAGNYGPAGAVAAGVLLTPQGFGGRSPMELVAVGYFFVMVAAIAVVGARRIGERRAWGRAALQADLAFPDLLIGVAFVGLSAATAARYLTVPAGRPDLALQLLHAGMGLTGAAFYVLRGPEQILARLLLTVAMSAGAAAVYWGGPALAARLGSADLRRLVGVAAVAALVLLLAPGRAWLGAGIDKLVVRRSRRAREDLAALVQGVAPELGTVECCRRALGALVRGLELRGAAVLLADHGTPVVEGSIRVDAIERAWPRETALRGATWLWSFPEGAAKRALVEADVLLVAPVASPRRSWGHLFLAMGFFGMDTSEASKETVEGFAADLARVLDSAHLLARALAVEGALAHAEKLAAIGEQAARVVHEIRNPVTAARSLAQQLAREPGSPFQAEHAVILAELERVERQAAVLLRFARREELRLEPVDLGALVRETVADLRARLEEAGVDVAVEAGAGVVARADREKLRQVLVNLIENAIHALAGAGSRRLVLSLACVDGAGVLRVTDTGPGVPEDVLPHLFEPFFTQREHGTGLGLAIARRTVEAHGGRITAESPPGSGMAVRIELPLASAPP